MFGFVACPDAATCTAAKSSSFCVHSHTSVGNNLKLVLTLVKDILILVTWVGQYTIYLFISNCLLR